jgi:hypothetical protein
MNHFIKFLFVAFIILFASCGTKWKETTNVGVRFSMLQNSNKFFSTTSATMVVGEIDFSGIRKEGGNVSFSRVETTPLSLTLNNWTTASYSDSYDIPQGVYTSINLVVKAVSQNAVPSISVSGTFTKMPDTMDLDDKPQTTPVLFELNSGENFTMNAAATNGSNQIVLIAGTPATCQITFDAGYWFATVTENQFKNATKYKVNGVNTIVINETQNEDIYSLVVARINQTPTAVFQ